MINSILIGEDNFVAQRLLLTMLERKYSKVVVVSTCTEILGALNRYRFDVLLLDYHLDRDADFILDEIAKEDIGYELPVYVISAEPEANIVEKLKGRKFEGYIPKSATEADLDRVLHTIATGRGPVGNQPIVSDRIDLTNLEKLLGNNPKKLNRIVSIFIQDAKAQLERMDELLSLQNFTELKRVVHRAKASYGYLGLHAITRQLTDWEQSLDYHLDKELHSRSLEQIKKEVSHIIYELTENYSSIVNLAKPSNARKENGKES